ncbi:hypothetical protein ACQR35_06820 [Pseudarthrobacter sp. J1738]|uniref:hypothetical protein n=1 Tax=Pseudarthrobacter sp. J1738 TaxID=3420446 RepID=UPI003D285186
MSPRKPSHRMHAVAGIFTACVLTVLGASGCSVTLRADAAAAPTSQAGISSEASTTPTPTVSATATAPAPAAAQQSPSTTATNNAARVSSLNRAEAMLMDLNTRPVMNGMPVVFRSASNDMQCSVDVDAAACYFLNNVPPAPQDIKGQCTGSTQYFGGYAVVSATSGAQYGLCGYGLSPMETDAAKGNPAFNGRTLNPGQVGRFGDIVCERAQNQITCAHLRTGHGFVLGGANYQLF